MNTFNGQATLMQVMCPNCGSIEAVPEGNDAAICSCCKRAYVVQEALDRFYNSQNQNQVNQGNPGNPGTFNGFPDLTQAYRRVRTCYNCGNELDDYCVACPYCAVKVDEYGNNPNAVNAGGYGPEYDRMMREHMMYQYKMYGQMPGQVPPGYVERKKSTAMALWFFGGVWGWHRFYNKKYITGILYMCTLGFFGIGWFADFFTLLAKPSVYYVKDK